MNKDNNSNPTATFLGGENVPLSKEINGKKSVFVKCLPVRLLAEYSALFTIESELIVLATDLSPDEVDMLSIYDSGVLFEKIHELNFEPFSVWLKRKVAASKRLAQAKGISLPNSTSMPDYENFADSLPES